MREMLHDLLEFCYPNRCANCEREADDPFLCHACEAQLRELEQRPACERCAMPLGATGGACPYCEGKGRRPFRRIVTLGAFRDPLRHLVYSVKYHRRWPIAERLAARMLEQERVKLLLSEIDCIVPVPLHRRRQIDRGFNQADVIARRLAKRYRKQVCRPAVRLRDTDSQTHLHSRVKREENLKDAFGLVDEWSLRDCHVVIIDDVMTTGATIESLARTLRFAEPASLSAIVVAVADPLGQDFQVI